MVANGRKWRGSAQAVMFLFNTTGAEIGLPTILQAQQQRLREPL